jgi:hypothetical protein
MKTMHVITTTGNGQFDAILAGCVGHLDEENRFQLDADYARLSYLFTLASGSSLLALQNGKNGIQHSGEPAAGQGEWTTAINLLNEDAAALKTNLIALCAQRWNEMYESVSTMVPGGGVGSNMLNAERQMVAAAVKAYIQDSGLQVWDVPVLYQAMVGGDDPSQRGTTESQLLAQAGMPLSIMLDGTRSVQRAAQPTQQPTQQATQQETRVPEAWTTHQGPLQLSVEGDLQVLAASAEQALPVGAALLQVCQQVPGLWQQLKPCGRAIQVAHLVEAQDEASNEADDTRFVQRNR